MKKKWWKAGIFILAMEVFLGSVSIYGRTKEKGEEHRVLTYAENQIDGYPTTQAALYFSELVESETDGRIEIVVKANGAMGTETEVLNQMQYGGIDLSRISLAQISEIIPEYNDLQLPYLYESAEHMWKVLDSEIGQEFLEKTKAYGLIGLSWYDGDVRCFYSSEKPITCLEDFKGLRIRIQESSIMEAIVTALGAYAVKVPYGDVYSYLERGLVDGAENNWPSYESMKHYEVAKYYTEDEHVRIPEIQLVSRHTWEKLSEEDQQIILESAKKAAEFEKQIWKTRVESAREKVIQKGTELIDISEEEKERIREVISSVYDSYVNDEALVEKIRQMAKE